MFSNLKLRGRIFAGFAIPVFLVLGFSGIVYFIGNKIGDTFKQVTREQEVLLETDDMVLTTALMARQARGYLLVKSPEPLREFEKQRLRYQRTVERADKVIVDPEQRKIFNQMVQTGEEFNAIAKETFQLIDQGKQAEAVSYYLRESKRVVGLLDSQGEEFGRKQQEILAQYNRNTTDSINFLILAALLTTLLTLLLASGAAYLIWATIAKTNRTINQTVNAIVSSSTEMAATIEQQEQSATHQASSVNQTTSTMNELAASSRQSAAQAESSAENARQVLNLAESSTVGARQVLNLAESSAENARKVLNLAESSTVGARQVLNLAESGTKTVEQTLEGMSELKEKVTAIAVEIIRLSEQTSQIGSITNIATDLANQTNMLALNAAVEAVRAGEHGKGFGVVASEIRKLADESKKSAEKISLLLIGIQGAINSTVMVTDEGRKTAEEVIKLSQGTAAAFTNVAEAIDKVVLKSSDGVVEAINAVILNSSSGVVQAINEVVLSNQQNSLKAINDIVVGSQQISLTAQQQAIAIGQVLEAMNNLNQVAIQTASGITQTKVGIHNLNEAAQSLKIVA